MTDRKTVFVSGKLYWAKVVGDKALTQNYERTGREWATDFMPNDTSFLKEHRLLDRLKEDAKGTIPGPYLRLRKPEFTKEGDKNEPIRIYNADDEAWDDRLIGNGSDADLKLSIVDWGKGKKQSIYVQAIRVTALVEFKSNEFGGMNKAEAQGEAKPAAKPKPKSESRASKTGFEAELDDDLPF